MYLVLLYFKGPAPSAEAAEVGGGSGVSVDASSPPKPIKLSPEEMRRRMEANRLKALERRRLKEQQEQHEQQQAGQGDHEGEGDQIA